jgi:hypothetical protein
MAKALDRSGFQTSGYITKKGTPVAHGAEIGYIFNKLPPGMNIDRQDCSDIRSLEMKRVVSQSYPGDGWEGSTDNPMDIPKEPQGSSSY